MYIYRKKNLKRLASLNYFSYICSINLKQKIMRYMGSKNRIAKDILPIILKDRKEGQYYVEPFCGGCNSIDKVRGNRIASDYNEYLIAMFKELLKGWRPKYYTKEDHYETRYSKDVCKHLTGYIGFVCSFRGIFFGGFTGKRTDKNGKTRDYQLEAWRNLEKQLPNLDGVDFRHCSYLDLEIPKNSIIYCDPPYEDVAKYNNDIDHEQFWNWCREKKEEGHQIFISSYEAPEDFECVWQKEVRNELSTEREIKTEKLFTL